MRRVRSNGPVARQITAKFLSPCISRTSLSSTTTRPSLIPGLTGLVLMRVSSSPVLLTRLLRLTPLPRRLRRRLRLRLRGKLLCPVLSVSAVSNYPDLTRRLISAAKSATPSGSGSASASGSVSSSSSSPSASPAFNAASNLGAGSLGFLSALAAFSGFLFL